MSMPEFDYLEPSSVAEACTMLAEDPEGSAIYAGGTDVLVYLKAGLESHRRLVSLGRISGLDETRPSASGGLSIGAMTTINAIARSRLVGERYPGIADAARSVAAEQVRNVATVAGNLCMAVPSADMAPILLAWNATLAVTNTEGTRTVCVRELFVGPRQTVLGPTDVVTSIEIPAPPADAGDASLRHGGRVSLSLPIAAAAAVLQLDDGVCTAAAIALGAVAPTPRLIPEAGERLTGTSLSESDLMEAAAIAAEHALPITDLRASREYRLELCGVLTRRVIATAASRAGKES